MENIVEVFTIDESEESRFLDRVNPLLKEGWVILSTSCGFINSEQYDFCSSWQAIMGKKSK